MALIEKLRQKPESHKKGIALAVSLLVTILILGVWVTVIFPGNISEQAKVSEKTQIEESPIKTFRRNIAQSFEAFKVQFGSFGQYFKSVEYESKNKVEIVPAMPVHTVNNQDFKTTETDNSATNQGNSVIY